jgi:hypothetical protein
VIDDVHGAIRPAGHHPIGASRPRMAAAGAVLSLALAACAQAGATQTPTTSALPTSVVPTTAAPSAAPTPEPPAPTPLNPAPAEMIGKWTSEFAEGDVATLDISATAIRIHRFGTATVRLEVFGDELVLSRSQLCVGEGRYGWSIVGDELRFDSVSPDACPDRAKTFDGATYTRVPS